MRIHADLNQTPARAFHTFLCDIEKFGRMLRLLLGAVECHKLSLYIVAQNGFLARETDWSNLPWSQKHPSKQRHAASSHYFLLGILVVLQLLNIVMWSYTLDTKPL